MQKRDTEVEREREGKRRSQKLTFPGLLPQMSHFGDPPPCKVGFIFLIADIRKVEVLRGSKSKTQSQWAH